MRGYGTWRRNIGLYRDHCRSRRQQVVVDGASSAGRGLYVGIASVWGRRRGGGRRRQGGVCGLRDIEGIWALAAIGAGPRGELLKHGRPQLDHRSGEGEKRGCWWCSQRRNGRRHRPSVIRNKVRAEDRSTYLGAFAIRTGCAQTLFIFTTYPTGPSPSTTWPIGGPPSLRPPLRRDTELDDLTAMEAGLERPRHRVSSVHSAHRDNVHTSAKMLAVPTPAPSSLASAQGCPHRSNPSSTPTQTSAVTPNFIAFSPPSCSPAAIRR